MTRLLLIGLGVIALEVGSQGIGLAIDCPSHPQQTGKDWEGEVNAAIAKIGPVTGGEVKTKAKTVTQDLLGKLPEAGKIYLEQMKYATICSSIRDDKTLSESEKRKQIRDYDLEIERGKGRQSSGAKRPASGPPQSKPQGKAKAAGPQSQITQEDTKQPEMQKSQPNVQDVKPYIECDSKGVSQTTLPERKVKGLAFFHKAPHTSADATEFPNIGVTGGRPDGADQRWSYVCQVTNYGTVPVLNMVITFDLRFLETVWLDSKGSFTHRFKFSDEWASPIRRLDPWPAERFTFLMKNTTNDWLEVTVSKFVDLEVLGESKKRSVPLLRPDNDPGLRPGYDPKWQGGTLYRSVFLFPPANFAQQNRPENWPQSPQADLQQRADPTE